MNTIENTSETSSLNSTCESTNSQSVETSKPEGDACHICNMTEVDDILYGPFMSQHGIRCHYFCLLFLTDLVQNGCDIKDMAGFCVDDIKAVVRQGKKKIKKCCYCGKKDAFAVCHIPSCRKRYHVPCGMKNNALFRFFGSFENFCNGHAKQIIVREDLPPQNQLCDICYELLGEYDPVGCFQPPCCVELIKEKEKGRQYWMHYRCVMQGARSLGYYFNCFAYACGKTTDEVKQGYLDCGIFIPKRDALYENGKRYKKIDKKVKVSQVETTYNTDATLFKTPFVVHEEVVCNFDRRCIARELGKNDIIQCAMEGCEEFTHVKCIRYYRDLKSNEEARNETYFCSKCFKGSCLALV